jgi:uncharacterized membrane protein HdeD (DUF308 family)
MTESRNTVTGPGDTTFERIASRWQLFIVLAVVLMALGFAAIMAATLATIVSVLVFGWALIIGGVLQAAHAIYQKTWRGRVLDVLTGVLFLVAGAFTLWRPVTSAVSLTLVLAVVLVVRGIFAIFAALSHRYPRWGWTVAYGLVSAVLGVVIAAQWPALALWVLGFYIGIELVVDGTVALALGLAARRAEMHPRGQPPSEARPEERATAPLHEPLPAT